MKTKKWVVGERTLNDEIQKISEITNYSYPMALLLYNKGIRTKDDIKAFFHLSGECLHSPFLLNDMDKACERILRAVENNEKICVYGDYDVDGITSTATLFLYLKSIGADVIYFIPNRLEDGYGVAQNSIIKLKERGVSLIVTVDTGITAVEDVEYAKTIGCEFVITDHHTCREILPDACAVVNPCRPDSTYPFGELAGVGVAFKLVCALEITQRKKNGEDLRTVNETVCKNYIDLVAIGTIADVMPLVGENRLIVSMGLRMMKSDKRLGLSALCDIADGKKGSRDITVSYIAYNIAPRLNAAGRMDSASLAVELFMSSSSDEAKAIAESLSELNEKRRSEEQGIINEIEGEIKENPDILKDNVVVLSSETWHHGVIGIVASRLTEKYTKPCILISFDGDMGKGSGRSVPGLNLSTALAKCADCLSKYGGHELAAGLSVERSRLNDFIKKINEVASECTEIISEPEVYADFELMPKEATIKFADELLLLEPCGTGNPTPSFVMRNMTVEDFSPIGNGKHTKMKLRGGDTILSVLKFGMSPDDIGAIPGDLVDIMFTVSVNEYNGIRSPQIIIKEIAPSRELLERYAADYSSYISVKNGETKASPSFVPAREDFAAVYRTLKRVSDGCGTTDIPRLMSLTGITGYEKLRFAMDILEEAGTVSFSETDAGMHGRETFKVSVNTMSSKVNLEETCLYRMLI